MNAHSLAARVVWLALAGTLAGCVVQPAPRPRPAPVPVFYEPVLPPPVVSVYIEPPLFQPPPVLVAWAPPPMLVEAPPPMPFGGALWVGGYWAWQGTWVWASGRWAPPPQPGYGWVNPYYEHRGDAVVFVTGHWSPPGAVFVPPPPGLSLSLAVSLPGVVPGPRPIGPPGTFVPPPPGSRPGLIVPAPVGTAPAVVVGAPPVTSVGMRIENRTTNINTVSSVTNITNVTIVAPASATASGMPFQGQAPAFAHLAAAQAPVMHIAAPTPASSRPIAAFAADRPPPALPPAQAVQLRREPQAAGAAAAPSPASTNPRADLAPTHSPMPTPSNSPGAVPVPAARAEALKRPGATGPASGATPRPGDASRPPMAQAAPAAKPSPRPAGAPPAPGPKPAQEKAKARKPPPKEGEKHREER